MNGEGGGGDVGMRRIVDGVMGVEIGREMEMEEGTAMRYVKMEKVRRGGGRLMNG